MLHAYVQLMRPAPWFAEIDFQDAAAAKSRIAAEFEGWTPALTTLIAGSDTAPVLPTINALPVGHRWDHTPGVARLGDAAHLPPSAGDGANLAMLDGAELGEALAARPKDIEDALAIYAHWRVPPHAEIVWRVSRPSKGAVRESRQRCPSQPVDPHVVPCPLPAR